MRGRLVVARAEDDATRSRTRRWSRAGTRCAAGSTQDAERRAAAQRLERAAGEWERLGRAREALWSGAARRGAHGAGEPDGRARARRRFVGARRGARAVVAARCSGRALPRRRRCSRVGVYGISTRAAPRRVGTSRRRARRHAEAAVGARRVATRRGRAAARARPSPRFDAIERADRRGALGRGAGVARQRADDEERAAGDALETALRIDAAPRRRARPLRRRARRARAPRRARPPARSSATSSWRASRSTTTTARGARRWNAPGELELVARRRRAPSQLSRYRDDDGHAHAPCRQPAVAQPPRRRSLPPGSYLTRRRARRGCRCSSRAASAARRRSRCAARQRPRRLRLRPRRPLPLRLVGQRRAAPRASSRAPPLHAVDTGAYLIARHETTFADWIAFLEALPPAERARRLPAGGGDFARRRRRAHAGAAARWQLTLQPRDARVSTPRWGEPIRYASRAQRARAGLACACRSPASRCDDAEAYARWLVGDRPRARRAPVHRARVGARRARRRRPRVPARRPPRARRRQLRRDLRPEARRLRPRRGRLASGVAQPVRRRRHGRQRLGVDATRRGSRGEATSSAAAVTTTVAR